MTFKHKLSKRLAQCHAAAAAALLALTACEASRTTSIILPSIAQVVITPDSIDIDPGQSQQFQVFGRDAAGGTLPVSVTWSATQGTISPSGAFTADTTLGDAVITAALLDGSLSATARVRKRRVVRVILTPANATIVVGGGQGFTTIGVRNSGDTVSVNANYAATGGIITNAGVYNAGLAAGSYRVIAVEPRTSLADTSIVLLTTAPVVPVASVTISPAVASVAPNGTAQLTAVTRDASGTALSGRTIVWTSANPGVASVSATGLVTGVAQGGGTTAVIAVSEGQADTATVTVTVAPPVPVASVTVTPSAASVAPNGSTQFTAVTRDASGAVLTGRSIVWTSANSAVATVSATGLVTGVAPGGGTTAVTATSEGQADTATVTVTVAAPAPVASVTITPSAASIAPSGTVQLAAVTRDASGAVLSGRTIVWTSANPAVATVSATGLVTGAGQGSGTTAVTAVSEGQADTATVTVTAPSTTGCTPTGSGVCRYVDAVAGNDANPGTSSAPYRTLQKAGSAVNPGDVVIVRNGVYTGGSTILSLSRSGTAANWIVVQAENKWGAVIDGQNNASATGIQISGSYIRVEGFEIFGTNHYGIEVYGGSDAQVAGNHIHDVGRYCTSTSGGIVGINAYAANLVIEQNVVHDIGRLAHGEAGCTTTNNYWQNHDHGVYQGQGDNLIIRNNVFYNFTRGWAIQRYSGSGTAVTNLQIVNNTFVGANPNKEGQIIIASPVTGLVITNNIFMQPNTAGVWFSSTGLIGTMANNLVYGASLSTGSALGVVTTGNQTGNPMFVNDGGRNYRLQSGSPAIGAGLILSLVTNDCDGVLRPSGAAPDVGAYQH